MNVPRYLLEDEDAEALAKEAGQPLPVLNIKGEEYFQFTVNHLKAVDVIAEKANIIPREESAKKRYVMRAYVLTVPMIRQAKSLAERAACVAAVNTLFPMDAQTALRLLNMLKMR